MRLIGYCLLVLGCGSPGAHSDLVNTGGTSAGKGSAASGGSKAGDHDAGPKRAPVAAPQKRKRYSARRSVPLVTR